MTANKQTAEYRWPWTRVSILLTFSMATLIGLMNQLEPETIVVRALTASAVIGVFARVTSEVIVATPRRKGGR